MTLQAYGRLEDWFALAQMNGLGITDRINAGDVLQAGTATPEYANKAMRLQAWDNRPATSGEYDENLPGGIGYMQIDNDFIIT